MPPSLLPLLAQVSPAEDPAARFIRLLTVFLLAMWVGFEVITKVPQRLHTPLTSGSNAISGITAVGAIVAAGAVAAGFRVGNLLGLAAVVLAMINVAGGFVVTHRMLQMFQPARKK
jgi:NAD(P) transhydrogenase subunit alpha